LNGRRRSAKTAAVRSDKKVIMRGFTALICIAWSALSGSYGLNDAAAATLCKADEVVVFSCPTGKHIASVCASRTETSGDSYMQYRFGEADKVDLSFPPEGTKPADVFAAGTMMFSGGGGTWLRFSNGAFRYNVFSASGKWGRKGDLADAAGVFVQKDGKNIASFPCRGEAGGEIGPDLFKSRGIPVAGPEENFDIPTAFMPK
jgi:hypothetical protein